MKKAAEVARLSTCQRSRCGSIIVKDDLVIGQGFNSPPGELESQRRCQNRQVSARFKSDTTCCMHAEQRAIIDALRTNSDKIKGADLFFVRLTDNGQIKFSDEPYCTICSKLALDVGLSRFILWHETGITTYPTDKYNQLSFAY